jgi:D-amino peptidase
MKKVLIACDLEGVNNVVGEEYKGLYQGCEQWKIAKHQAALEINAAAEALFEAGAECVHLWDNHAGGGNIDVADLDGRVKLLEVDNALLRMYFGKDYDCVIYFGYHAMEGTLGGVLAHTMNSSMVQHYKLNGKYIGEVDMDAYIAASHGIPSVMFVGGDIACSQAARAVPGIATVVTKRELSRNEARFRDNSELFADIKQKARLALVSDIAPVKLSYPSVMEKSFKRVEDAANYLERLKSLGIEADYIADEILGKDAHTVAAVVNNVEEFIRSI